MGKPKPKKKERDLIKEAIEWCDIQYKRWSKKGYISEVTGREVNREFRQGVLSGYGWMKDHLKHIKSKGIKCRCPR